MPHQPERLHPAGLFLKIPRLKIFSFFIYICPVSPLTPSTMKQPDYIAAILTSDRPVLTALYRQFFPMIQKMVLENGGSAADAQDVFQEALGIILDRARQPGFQLTSQFGTFLYGIAFNCWRGHRKKKSFSEVSIPKDAALIPDDSSEAGDKAELWQLFYRAFARLGEDCRALLLLFFEKKPMAEIAGIMGYAGENYAARRKHTCKKRLIELIKSDPEYDELHTR